MDAGTAQSYSNTQDKKDKLKWKKITDYSKDVHTSYKSLRNINVTIYDDEYYSRLLWLGTQAMVYTDYAYHIIITGEVRFHGRVCDPFGLRPVITK